ncbi:MAG: type II and III secretion system protein family protein, partial [Opitutae bacterium]|nr:type II and III secretion system protein family protein [Opitutae bacterium]
VNNPDIVDLTPLAPNVIQVSAKNPGVTQINLWGEDKRIYTVDVIVYRDVRELEILLQSQFPNANLKVVPVGSGVMISGFVDDPEHVRLITRIAEEYYPKVIPAMTVSGVHQVLLHVRVMEVSRTKLRALGFDFAKVTGSNFVVSGVSGLISSFGGGTIATSGQETFSFGVVDGSSAFFGVLDAMRQDQLMKILAEPTLVTVSGRPAFFQVGGEFPILVPQSLGTVSIEYKKFGTQVDFVPIVLGNGRIRLEVRPRVSEIDNTRSVTLDSTTVPGLRTREIDTGVEMNAGQTLAIAGLVQTRVESENKGLPWASELPYLGALFRRVQNENNEIELLILVTPELVEAMEAHEVPPCGPGTRTTDPDDWDLYMRGHLEVPACCPSCGAAEGACEHGGQALGQEAGRGGRCHQHGQHESDADCLQREDHGDGNEHGVAVTGPAQVQGSDEHVLAALGLVLDHGKAEPLGGDIQGRAQPLGRGRQGEMPPLLVELLPLCEPHQGLALFRQLPGYELQGREDLGGGERFRPFGKERQDQGLERGVGQTAARQGRRPVMVFFPRGLAPPARSSCHSAPVVGVDSLFLVAAARAADGGTIPP